MSTYVIGKEALARAIADLDRFNLARSRAEAREQATIDTLRRHLPGHDDRQYKLCAEVLENGE